jgi:integrase
VERVCKLAGIPRVTPHGLRGTHSSIAVEAGQTPVAVAAALGHTSPAITKAHYVRPESMSRAHIRRVNEVLRVETTPPEVVSTGVSGPNRAA